MTAGQQHQPHACQHAAKATPPRGESPGEGGGRLMYAVRIQKLWAWKEWHKAWSRTGTARTTGGLGPEGTRKEQNRRRCARDCYQARVRTSATANDKGRCGRMPTRAVAKSARNH